MGGAVAVILWSVPYQMANKPHEFFDTDLGQQVHAEAARGTHPHPRSPREEPQTGRRRLDPMIWGVHRFRPRVDSVSDMETDQSLPRTGRRIIPRPTRPAD
jgi:hypothetical protein